MASVRESREASSPTTSQNYQMIDHVLTVRAGFRYYYPYEKFAPPGVQTSDGFIANEDWELWRITIPAETDEVGWEIKASYSMEVAVTEGGIMAFRKERPRWMMGNRYDSWEQLDTDKLNEHLGCIRSIQEMTLNYNLNLLEGEERMTEAEMAEIMEVSGVADLQKDDEIALLKQSIDHLERENEVLRAGLRGIVYDRKMSAVHGIDWKLLRDKVEVIQKPQDGKLEGCVEARKVQNG